MILFLWVLSSAIPAALSLLCLWRYVAWPAAAKLGVAAVVLVWIAVVANIVRSKLVHQFRTLSTLLESIRSQDYTMKGVRARERGDLGELYRQINNLTDSLKNIRQSEQELLIVLEKVVSEMNVAVIVFDARDRIRLVNQSASSLLKAAAADLNGVNCADTILAGIPVSAEPRLIDFRFPGAEGRWQIRQHAYRHQGQSSRILIIADLKQVLSDGEISAWQRLIRVISHEVNNSLTPISSLSQTLANMLDKSGGLQDGDVREGLSVIAERAKGLQDFISGYARLARLPEPRKSAFPAAELAAKLGRFFAGQPLDIVDFPHVMLFGDEVQLEQALINLIKNGLEANPPGAPPVQLSCRLHEGQCSFQIADHGPGIVNPDNLFVPFYTTKAEGAGIGLILSRQIAARHHGQVTLENRPDGTGALAQLVVPLPPQRAAH
jgi:nitrogen fixation/metabolism regulation signal transduction histidine kinase